MALSYVKGYESETDDVKRRKKKMNKKRWKQNFYLMQNFNNFSKYFFFVKFSKILDSKLKRNFTWLQATYDLRKLQKLMKQTTFPWLIMQKHTLQPNKKMKEIFLFI